MNARGPEIPEDLAKGHAKTRAGQSAAESARELGAKWTKTFRDLGGLRAGQSVLDIGCGPGRMAIAIGEAFAWDNDYLGFDVNAADIDFCTREITGAHPRFRFLHVDAKNPHYNPKGRVETKTLVFPAPDASIGFAFATSVFTHMFRDDVAHFVRETLRCLKPGGVFLSTWFLRHEAAEAEMQAGRARFAFAHRKEPGVTYSSAAEPAKAVAFTRDAALALFSGYADVTHCQGGWANLKGRHSQDIIVARKP